MVDNQICPDCKSTDTWKLGYTFSRQGKKQRYQCKKCGRTFTAPEKTQKTQMEDT